MLNKYAYNNEIKNLDYYTKSVRINTKSSNCIDTSSIFQWSKYFLQLVLLNNL